MITAKQYLLALGLNDTFLPLRPSSQDKYVLTVFLVDNFDVKVERQIGATSLHTTHMVAFQGCRYSVRQNAKVNIDSRKRKLQPCAVRKSDVNPKMEPPLFTAHQNVLDEESITPIMMKHFLWLWIRKQNSYDQLFATCLVRSFVYCLDVRKVIWHSLCLIIILTFYARCSYKSI